MRLSSPTAVTAASSQHSSACSLHVALAEEDAALGIQPGGDEDRRGVEDALAQHGRVVLDRDGVQVDDAVDRRVAAVLALDVLDDRADVVAEVLAAGRLDAGEDDGHSGWRMHGALGGAGLVEPADRRRVGRVAGGLGVLGRLGEDLPDRRRRRRRASRASPSRSARPAAPPPPAAGSRPSAGGSRGRAAAWRGRASGCPSARFIGPPDSTNSCMQVRSKAGGRCSPATSRSRAMQVVGVQHGGLRRLLQPVAAERQDVGVGAHEDAVVALEAAQAADRLRPVEVEVEGRPPAVLAVAAHDLRARQVRLDARPRRRSARRPGRRRRAAG